MRAVTISSYGEPSVLELSEIDEPVTGPGQVRIRTAAAGVNPVDLATRSGIAAGAIPNPTFPMVLGWDLAGTVEEIGEGVRGFVPGDRVIAMSLWFRTQTGAYAEQVVLNEQACAIAPEGVGEQAAATIPLNGLTAWAALAVARAQAGDRLLVTGAAGAVGGFVVELASRRGLEVVGFGRADDLDAIKGFGAAEVADDLGDVGMFDFAVDTTGHPDIAVSHVAPGGRLVTLSGSVSENPNGVIVKPVGVREDPDALGALAKMAAEGVLTLRVADVFGFDQAADAHTKFAAGGIRGRVVLQP